VSGRQLADKPSERSQKSIVFEVLPAAIGEERSGSLSGLLDKRGLFYAVRRKYLTHPERPREAEKERAESKKNPEHILDYEYFCHKLLPKYERQFGEIEGLTTKAVGKLYSPHVDDEDLEQMIGTAFVEGFVPPEYYYDKVLYCEKDGISRQLRDSGIGERYDMAIIGPQGYGTEADRDLLAIFDDAGYTILVLHDCDIDGYGILANVRHGNERARGMYGDVIDLGVSLDDARDLDLLGEEAIRQKAIPETTVSELTDEELELFTGTPRTSKSWQYTRFEINEVPAEERVPFVERALERAGLVEKVMPPDKYLDDETARRVESDIKVETAMAIEDLLADEIKEAMVERFTDRYNTDNLRQTILDKLEDKPRSSWRKVLGRLISDQGTALRDNIRTAVSEYLPSEDSEAGEENGQDE
jgi:hypothetical protein